MRSDNLQRSSLEVDLGPIRLPNPIMNASGTGGYGTEELPFLVPETLGAFVTKGLSIEPRLGNPPPRIVETPSGMLNAIGLENVGIEAFVRDHLPRLRRRGVRVIVNLFGETEDEYLKGAEQLSSISGIHALEINVSCPNVKRGGQSFGTDPDVLHRLVRALRGCSSLPLIIKLTPDAVDLLAAAQASWEGGCDALTVANTYRGMAVDIVKRRPRLSIGSGGLSGPAIRPLTLYRVWQVSRASPVPVIGAGGIASTQDALEFIIAGATAVQIGTGFFINPSVFGEIEEGLISYMREHGFSQLSEVIGSLNGMPDDFHRIE